MNTFSKYTLAFFKNANNGWLPVMTNIFELDDDNKEKFPQIFSKKNLNLLEAYKEELKKDVYLYFNDIFNILKNSPKYNITLKHISSRGYNIEYFYQGFPFTIENNVQFNLVISIYNTNDNFLDIKFKKPHIVYALYYNGSEKNNDTIAYKIRERINKKDDFIKINENLDYYFDEYICAYSYGIEISAKTTADYVAKDIQKFLDDKLIKNMDMIKTIVSVDKK